MTSSDEEELVVEAQPEPAVHQVDGNVIGPESDDDEEVEQYINDEHDEDDSYFEEEYDDDILFPDGPQIAPPQYIYEDFYPTAEDARAAYSAPFSARARRDPDGFKQFAKAPPDEARRVFTYFGFNGYEIPEDVTHLKFGDFVKQIQTEPSIDASD